jgi:hypothetical protein
MLPPLINMPTIYGKLTAKPTKSPSKLPNPVTCHGSLSDPLLDSSPLLVPSSATAETRTKVRAPDHYLDTPRRIIFKEN